MTTKSLLAIAPLAGALLLAGCGTPAPSAAPADTGKVADEVKDGMGKVIAAFNAHDAAGSVAMDAADYVGMLHGTPNVIGPAGDLALTKQQIADPAQKVDAQNAKVDVAASGDMAVWQATYAYTLTDPVKKVPATEHGNWVTIWKKQADGSMKVATSVVSDTGAATPSTK